MGLGNMIEAALQQMQREQEQEEGELDENDDFLNPESTEVLEDADYQEYYDELEAQVEQDGKLMEEFNMEYKLSDQAKKLIEGGEKYYSHSK